MVGRSLYNNQLPVPKIILFDGGFFGEVLGRDTDGVNASVT